MKGSLQIKNGIYQAVFYSKDENGKQKTIWKSTGIPAARGNKRKAEQRMLEIREELLDCPPTKETLFVDYAKKWLRYVMGHIDPVTYQGYKQYVERHIIPYFKSKELLLHKVSVRDIESYYVYKSSNGRLDGKSGGLSYHSLKRHSVVLNMIFREAVRDNIIKVNPCIDARIPKPKVSSAPAINFYTTEQCSKLLEVTSGTVLHDMIYITFIYGLRRSELMGLRWCDIDFEKEILTIQHTVVVNGDLVVEKDSTKTKSSNRVYPLLSDVKKILEKIKNDQKENRALFGNCYENSDYVFVKEDGSKFYPSYPTQGLQKTIKKYDLPPIRWHDLRHSCASMLILKGWGMKDISDWLGHSGIAITMNLYTHLDIAHKRDMAKNLEGILGI